MLELFSQYCQEKLLCVGARVICSCEGRSDNASVHRENDHYSDDGPWLARVVAIGDAIFCKDSGDKDRNF